MTKIILSELKRLWKSSDIWRSLIEYMGVDDLNELTDLVNKGVGIFGKFETTLEYKRFGSDIVVELFENEVWESYRQYLIETNWTEQKGGWLGANPIIEDGIRDFLAKFRSGGNIRYAKALIKWKNSTKYPKWIWRDWYIEGDDVANALKNENYTQGGKLSKTMLDALIADTSGFEKLEGIKEVWKTQNNR